MNTSDPITEDPVPDREYPASLLPVTFKSGGEQLLGVIFQAQGEGPHPAIVLLHGFPGFEWNLDLAHIFRRAGWSVLVFHYRGAWGSPGTFSFTHVLQDVDSALFFMRSENACKLYCVNPQEIVLIGHSMGGFAALMTAAKDPSIYATASIAGVNMGQFSRTIETLKNREITLTALEQSILPLQGTSPEKLVCELSLNAESWDLLNYTKELSRHPLLLIGANRDETAPIDLHYWPLVRALGAEHADFTHAVLDADHMFSEKRIALARTLLSWLESL